MGGFRNRCSIAASHNSLARNIIESDPIDDETIAITADIAIIKPNGGNSIVSIRSQSNVLWGVWLCS